ncbi:hypothetical protein pb186bvf_011734 [Paramecium bursaria]
MDNTFGPFNFKAIDPALLKYRNIGFIVGIIKLILLIIPLCYIMITNDIIYPLVRKLSKFKWQLSLLRKIVLLNNFFIGRLILFIIGYFKYKSIFCKTSGPISNFMNLRYALLFCTKSSPIDVLASITLYSPTFTQVLINSQSDHISYDTISYTKAIINSFREEKAQFQTVERDGKSLLEILVHVTKMHTGPAIIYYEGGVTNGMVHLAPDQKMEQEIQEIDKQWIKARDFSSEKRLPFTPVGVIVANHDERVLTFGYRPYEIVLNILSGFQFRFEMQFARINQNQNLLKTLEQLFKKLQDEKVISPRIGRISKSIYKLYEYRELQIINY